MNFSNYNPYREFRTGQEVAIKQLLDSWTSGNKVLELNAPTASGKTVILYVLGRILEKEYGLDKVVFTSPQVALIESGNLFDLPKLVGKRNYRCLGLEGCTAEECPFTSKEEGFAKCEGCYYREARKYFQASKFGATTFSRYLTDPSIHSKTEALVIDESSELEGLLLDKSNIELDLKIKDITKKVKVSDQANDVRQFLKTFDVSSHLTEQKKSLQKLVTQLSKQCQDYRKAIFVSKPTSREIKKLKAIQADYNRYHRQEVACTSALRYIDLKVPYVLATDIQEVWNPLTRRKEYKPVPTFKLLDAHLPFSELISDLQCVVLASGTPVTDMITSKFSSIRIGHPISKDRRLIHYDPVGLMSYSERERTAVKMAARIKQLHDTYSAHTIVHCGSYYVAEIISEHLYRLHNNVILQRSGEREYSLNQWIRTPDSIFLSVRFEEGISLDGPEFPMNIIAKVPYPNLTDEWVTARNNLDSWTWYNKTSAMLVQQACGRTTRGPDDFSETWILDSSFSNLYNRSRRYFLPWFQEALVS